MYRFAGFIALVAFLTMGLGAATSFAIESAPAEEKEKKESNGGKASEDQTKDQKKEVGGK